MAIPTPRTSPIRWPRNTHSRTAVQSGPVISISPAYVAGTSAMPSVKHIVLPAGPRAPSDQSRFQSDRVSR
jgi:hypothetical protein